MSNGAPVSLAATVTLGRRHPRGPLHPHPSGLLPLLVSNLCPLFGQHVSLEPTSYPFFFFKFFRANILMNGAFASTCDYGSWWIDAAVGVLPLTDEFLPIRRPETGSLRVPPDTPEWGVG